MVADRERDRELPDRTEYPPRRYPRPVVRPATASQEVLGRMKAQSERFMRACGYEGILAIEYFIRVRGDLLQRDGAASPQLGPLYDRGARRRTSSGAGALFDGDAVAGTPPGSPDGDEKHPGSRPRRGPGWIAREGHHETPSSISTGKTESRPKRKMGHITFVGMTAAGMQSTWADRFVK